MAPATSDPTIAGGWAGYPEGVDEADAGVLNLHSW